MIFGRSLRRWMCNKLGHNRVLLGSARARCTRCGNVRPLYAKRPMLMDEYLDEVDPDPA